MRRFNMPEPHSKCILKESNGNEIPLIVKETYSRLHFPDNMMEMTLTCLCDFDKLRDQNETDSKPSETMESRHVIYNPPATIVLWADGSKTVVKCDPRDTYDPKYGLALCYMKKALGNTSRALNDVLHREAVKD